MNLIVCVDDRNGMLFHGRRQSQDRILREDIRRETSGARLWMNSYSAKLFAQDVCIAEDCLKRAGAGEFCLVEDLDPALAVSHIERIWVYRWNKRYPADRYFTIPVERAPWRLERSEELIGSSHEKITKDVYCHETIV